MTRPTWPVTLVVTGMMSILPAPRLTGAPSDAGSELQRRLAAARPGEIIDVPPGKYHGPFLVGVPVHLRGHGAHLIGDGLTHVVSVRAADVTIEGFEISNSGLDLSKDQAAIHITGARAVVRNNRISESLHGVYVRQADGVRIEGNTIIGKSWAREPVDPFAGSKATGGGETCEVVLTQDRRGNGIHVWNSAGHLIANNVIRETRDGIYFSFVDRSEVRENDIQRVRYGLHYMYSDDNAFRHNEFRENAAGAALMYSTGILLEQNVFAGSQNQRAHGLLLYSVDDTDVAANRLVGNTVGLFIEHSRTNRFQNNLIAKNNVGVHITNSSDANVFAGNSFVGNLHQVEASGSNMANTWAVDGRGNHWDTASRLDLDGDGVGDVPHRELDLFGEWRRAFPVIGLLAGSPGERLLRFVHGRVLLPGLPGISDPAPLIVAPTP